MADTTYVTEEELKQFSDELTKYVTESISNEEVAYSGVVKEYVESKVSELELKLVNNPEWLKVKANIEELVKIFDADEDGKVSPEEVLAKLGEFNAKIANVDDKVNKLSEKVDSAVTGLTSIASTNTADIKNLKESTEKSVADLNTKVEDLTKEVAEKATGDLDEAKKEINEKIETEISALDTKAAQEVSNVFQAIREAMKAGYEAAESKLDERMNNVRGIFGLPKTTKTSTDGDGTAV
jgi:ParB-like chromosome segregation protein Spo0J